MRVSPHTIILVRHAHAEWPDYRGRDFDRPLTPRGRQEAEATGRAIRETGLRPQLVLASAAARTRETAEIILAELGVPAALRCIEPLYNAAPDVLETCLREATAQHGTPLMLIAHNPGVSDLARQLAGEPRATPFEPAAWRVLPLR